jgi:lipoprotein-releasing system permease protein
MRWEPLVGLRYLVATRNEVAPSIITVISVLAVSIGVIALIVVLAVMGGFEGDLRKKILGARAHVLISGPDMEPLQNAAEALAIADGVPGLLAASPYIESELLVTSPSQYSAVVLRGIELDRVAATTDLATQMRFGELAWLNDTERAREFGLLEMRGSDAARELDELREQTRELSRQLDEIQRLRENLDSTAGSGTASGSGAELSGANSTGALAGSGAAVAPRRSSVMPPLPPPSGVGIDGAPDDAPRRLPGLVLGSELQESLNVVVGETVDIIDPDGPVGPTGPTPIVRKFRVVGVFHSGLYEYDNRYAFTLLSDARAFLGVPDDEVSGIEMRALNPEAAGELAEAVRAALATAGRDDAKVSDWMELNSTLFAALMLEKFVMGGIMMVIVMVASFAIICVLIMVVIQRGAEIAILRTMGASRPSIMAVFVAQGGAIGFLGTLLGGVVGLALALALQHIGFPLDPEVYYIDQLPVEVDPREVAAILIGALAISLLATLYPSVQAARLDPAGGLRYE